MTPPPRRALRVDDDGVHAAAAHLDEPSVDLPPAPRGRGARRKVAEPDGKQVELVVRMPKSMRKALRARAEEQGTTAEDAAYQLLRVWLGR